MAKKPCGTWIVTDVPEAEVGATIADFKLQAPKSVESKKQADGKYTVTAIFKDCTSGNPKKVTEKSHEDA
jgi:hypothetical protein